MKALEIFKESQKSQPTQILTTSNEKIIREKAKELLSKNFDGIIVDEFGLINTRPDIVILGEYFVFVEIKSDKDTLTRLDSQIEEYTRYGDIVIVVVDVTHKEKAIKKYGAYNASFYYYEDGKIYRLCGGMEVNEFRNIENKNINITSYKLNLLWANERRQLLSPLGGCANTREIEALKYCYTIHEIDRYSREMIISRWEYLSQREKRYCNGYRGGKITSDISHIEYKKLLMKEFKESKKKE